MIFSIVMLAAGLLVGYFICHYGNEKAFNKTFYLNKDDLLIELGSKYPEIIENKYLLSKVSKRCPKFVSTEIDFGSKEVKIFVDVNIDDLIEEQNW